MGDAPIGGPPAEFDDLGVMRGRWPRMINLEAEVEADLKLWLDEEISQHLLERSDLVDQWSKYQNQYWAEPKEEVKNFPFARAANIVIPLTAIAVEAAHARLINTLFSVKPFWSVRPKSKAWIKVHKPTERYLQSEAESAETLDVFKFCDQSILELIKLGTAVGKSGYKREFRKSMRFYGDEDEEPHYYEAYNGATLEYVPVANFMMRLNETEPQESSWCGERHKASWAQLKRMVQGGQMIEESVDYISTWWVDAMSADELGDPDKVKRVVQEISDTEPLWTSEFRFYEIWCSFDVDGDGWNEEIVLDYHKDSGTILSIRYNWYDDLHRPYRINTYFPVEGIWPGIGIGRQNEQFQAEVTTIHRQRLDNATLANMAQIVLGKNTGYGPGEPIFPGKMWFVDDPMRDIQEFKLSEVYPSSYANEESVVRYSEKRTGVNEIILGLPQEGTPGTATGDLARLAESNKRFDHVLKGARRWLSLLGLDVLANYQQFGNQEMHWLYLGEEGKYVEAVLQMPPELARKGVAVELTVTDSITNRDVEQRQWMQLFQIVTNYYAQVLTYVQIISQLQGDPTPMLEVSQRALMTADEALRRLLETFNIIDPESFTLTQEGDGDQSGGPGSAAGTVGGGQVGPEGGGQAAGLEGLGSLAGLVAG